MRVLHLYAGNLFGGIERMLLTLSRARDGGAAGAAAAADAAAAGGDASDEPMRHHFGLCFEGNLWEKLRNAGAPVTILGSVRVSRPWTVSTARRRLRELLAREKFDVVVTHSFWPHGLFAPAVRSTGLPLVMWMHDIPTGRGWLENRARRVAPDLVLANSTYTASQVSRLFGATRCEVQHPPIEPPPVLDRQQMRRHWRSEMRTPADAHVVVIACRWQRWKGHDVLVRALAMLPQQTPWSCWIAGQPQRPAEQAYRVELEDLIEQLNIPLQVRFLGHCDELAEVLTAADLYCQPNTAPEPFGIVFAEALATGLPVVTSDLGGAREIVDATCGRLVPPGDVEALSAQLDVLLSDSDLRARLSEAAAWRARERFGLAESVRRLQKHLQSVLPAAMPLEAG